MRLLVLFVLIIFVASANAEDLPWTWDCAEIIHAEANEQFDDYTVRKDDAFEITFSRVDDDNWMMTGNAGSVPVVPMMGPNVIHFLESTAFGTINVTQISLTPRRGIHLAVHSRHPVLLDTMAPSQFLLECSVR